MAKKKTMLQSNDVSYFVSRIAILIIWLEERY